MGPRGIGALRAMGVALFIRADCFVDNGWAQMMATQECRDDLRSTPDWSSGYVAWINCGAFDRPTSFLLRPPSPHRPYTGRRRANALPRDSCLIPSISIPFPSLSGIRPLRGRRLLWDSKPHNRKRLNKLIRLRLLRVFSCPCDLSQVSNHAFGCRI